MTRSMLGLAERGETFDIFGASADRPARIRCLGIHAKATVAARCSWLDGV